MKIAIVSIATILIAFLGYSIYQSGFTNDRWSKVIEEHKRVSDSLRSEMNAIVMNVQKKDSLMLSYMSSLDHTLEVFKKESIKNGIIFHENLAKQDSIRLKYCEEMAKLGAGFKPSDCQ